MKAIEVLRWICRCSISGEDLFLIDVPEEGENEYEQNEQWWLNVLGYLPAHPMPAGHYLCYYESAIHESIQPDRFVINPDTEVEVPIERGFDYIYLYKLED